MTKRHNEQRKPWETPVLRRVGDVADIVQFPGGGKLSTVADDPGDPPRKSKGQE